MSSVLAMLKRRLIAVVLDHISSPSFSRWPKKVAYEGPKSNTKVIHIVEHMAFIYIVVKAGDKYTEEKQ